MGRFHSPRRYQGRTLAVPKAAMFPNQIGDVKFDRFWNFLCRQIYVLTQTYATDTQRAIAIPQYAMNGAAHACIAIGGVCASLLTMYLLVAMTAGALAVPWHSPQPAPLGAQGQCNFAAGAQSMPNEWPTWRSALLSHCRLVLSHPSDASIPAVWSSHIARLVLWPEWQVWQWYIGWRCSSLGHPPSSPFAPSPRCAMCSRLMGLAARPST